MGKLIKWLFGLIFILVLLVVGAVLVLPQFIDPNDYKDEIVAVVKRETGRDLSIGAPLDLSVFPWLGVNLGQVSFSNAPGFGDDPFAAVDNLQVRIKLLPLLSKRVEVDTLVLKGMQLNLARNAKGVSNWDDLVKETAEKPEAGEKPGAGELPVALDVGGILIEGAGVVWDDRQQKQRFELSGVQLKTGALRPGSVVPVEAALHLVSSEPALKGDLQLSAQVKVGGEMERIDVAGLELKLRATGAAFPGGDLELNAQADAALNLEEDSLAVSNFRLAAMGLNLQGDVKGSAIRGAAVYDGKLTLAETNLRTLLERLNVLPETADGTALTRASGELGIHYAGKALAIKPLTLALDDSQAKGYVEIKSFSGPVVRGELALDDIDLDRYLPPKSEQAAAEKPAAPTSDDPFAALRPLDLNFKFTVGHLKVNNLHMNNMLLVAKSKNGVLRLEPMEAALYEGKFDGMVELDARKKTPKLHAKKDLVGIQAGPLLKDLVGKDKLTGKGEVHADLNMVGLSEQQIRNSLNGTARFAFVDGAYKGINVAALIRNARGMPAVDEPPQTDFSELSGSADIRNGIINNKDLQAKSPLLRIAGEGTVNLPQNTIDYLLTTEVVGSLEGQGGIASDQLKGVAIPVRLTGDLYNPSRSVDPAAFTKAIGEQKVEEKKEELREKLRDRLQDKLKGFF